MAEYAAFVVVMMEFRAERPTVPAIPKKHLSRREHP
jgi:hypothetical protein